MVEIRRADTNFPLFSPKEWKGRPWLRFAADPGHPWLKSIWRISYSLVKCNTIFNEIQSLIDIFDLVLEILQLLLTYVTLDTTRTFAPAGFRKQY